MQNRQILSFYEKPKNGQFRFANISMKEMATEKTKYTMTTATENATKLSLQIFDFQNFVTEIFPLKVRQISFFCKIKKITNFNNFGDAIARPSLTPRSKLLSAKLSSVQELQTRFYSLFWSGD